MQKYENFPAGLILLRLFAFNFFLHCFWGTVSISVPLPPKKLPTPMKLPEIMGKPDSATCNYFREFWGKKLLSLGNTSFNALLKELGDPKKL